MKIVQTILTKTGLSQRALARFLNTNDSVLSRYEAATRSMPVNTMLPLVHIQQLLTILPTPPPPSPSAEDIATLQQRAAYCTAQAAVLQQQLQNMQLQYIQAATLLQLIAALQADTTPKTEKQQRWLDEQQYQANKKIAQYGWLPQQQLLNSITLLTQEAIMCNTIT
jgi:transcriptional regulator with XRE-family HTH domain